MSIAESAVTAVLGYVVVFVGLALLMFAVVIMGGVMTSRKKPAPAAVSAPAPEPPKAPGSAGKVSIYDVPDRDAALIMAIVADQMGKPLNELRFKSIREVKQS